MKYNLLAADIGGTNSLFAVFTIEYNGNQIFPDMTLQKELWLKSGDYPEFRDVMRKLRHAETAEGEPFLEPLPAGACFAVAGPVRRGTSKLPNVPWTISEQEIQSTLGIPHATLINDFYAQGQASCMATQLGASCIYAGTPVKNAPHVVVGAGTGCGKATVLTHPAVTILPSEGGHCTFPFEGKEEFEFAVYLADKLGHTDIIGDMIVSGSGLQHIFAFHTGQTFSANEISRRIDENPVVLEWFSRFYARVCRHFILDTLALGGLYITGGIAKHIPVLHHPAFLETLHHSPTQSDLLQSVPVWHMHNQSAGLYGAALHGAQALGSVVKS